MIHVDQAFLNRAWYTSLPEGEVPAVEQVGEDGDGEGVPDGHADLVLDLIEDEQQVLSDYEDAADYDNGTQGPPPVPVGLRFPALLEAHPPEVLALLEQEDPLELDADEQVGGEDQELDEPELAEGALAGLVEDEEEDGGDYFGEDAILIDVHVELGIFLAELVEEEDDGEEEVHEDNEGVDVVVLDDDADEQQRDIEDAEVDDEADAARERHEVQRVLELEVLVGELELLEEQEDDAVDDNAQLVLHARAHDRGEEVDVVAHQHPLEDQHVVHVLRPQRRLARHDHHRLIVGLHAHYLSILKPSFNQVNIIIPRRPPATPPLCPKQQPNHIKQNYH